MAGIPQLEDEQPILQGQKINSGAESHEAFAKTLGAISEESFKEAKTIATDKSQTMYINSVANVEQLKTGAQIRMLEHPDQVAKITEQTNAMMEEVRTNSYVNHGDRGKLNKYIQGAVDSVELKGTEIRVRQNQREAAFTHFANWNDQLKAYNQALLTNPAQADELKEGMLKSLHGLVAVGAITPTQAGNSVKTMSDVHDVAQDYYENIQNPHATAKDYHTSAASPLTRDNDHTTAPLNGSTGWLMDHHNSAKTFQDVEANIYKRITPNPEEYTSLKPNQREQAKETIMGVQVADGMINSGESFAVIEKTHQSLSESGKVLTYREQATRNALGTYIAELKNGNYLTLMAQTPMGNAIMNDFTMRNAAIGNTAVDQQKKYEMMIQNKNKLVNESVSYGEGHHIPGKYIQPIPQGDIANVQSGFELGQKPEVVLQTLGQYTPANQAYVANAMKNPNQRMVVSGVALAGDNIKPQDKLDFIAANQTGRRYLGKNIEDTAKDDVLMSRISTNLSASMRIVGKNYDYEQAQSLQLSMLATTLNYAKYLAQKGHPEEATSQKEFNVSTSDWKNYVDQASKIYASSFQQLSGTNWMVNPNQLPQKMTNSELDVLADHVTNEGYKALKAGRNDSEYESAIGRNPLRMIMSPTNEVQAVDNNGKVYYSMPFTANVIPFAQESKKAREVERRRMLSESNERAVKERLHVRLPEDANS